MSERQMMLKKVQEAEFSLIDTILFLDTHPTDRNALTYYDKCREILKRVRAQYTQKYGPLTSGEVEFCDRFNWVDNPWPWEVED